ncbi:DUF819 family protein [Myxococcota bacterium]
MEYAVATAEVLLSLLVPLAVLWLEPRSRVVRFLSPVVVCYGVGILFGNQPLIGFSNPVALTTCNVTVALAIPLLLFSVNIGAWLRLAKNTVISFFFCMLAVMVSSTVVHYFYRAGLEESHKMAGMLVGVYTGGTPNMAAIGTALQVKSETFILLNAADIMASFVYLFFILVLAVRIPHRFLPATPKMNNGENGAAEVSNGWKVPATKVMATSLGLTIVIVACGVLFSRLFSEGSRDAVAILVITTLAVVASMFKKVRGLKGTHDMGQFLLLVFCVAMGFTTDFTKLFSASPAILIFTALVLWGAVLIHFLLSLIARIDRDTVIVTSAAAIFGPHMVGPVTVAMKNRDVLFSGLASGLVGYAVGNYLGMGLAWMLS